VGGQKQDTKENIPAIAMIHPGANTSTLSSSVLDLQGQITYAPINTMSLIIIPPPKGDLFGVGYDPAIENPGISPALLYHFLPVIFVSAIWISFCTYAVLAGSYGYRYL
jgi:hypothetical protein